MHLISTSKYFLGFPDNWEACNAKLTEFYTIFLCFINLKYSRCQLLACPELLPPENGRFVHHQKCSNVFNSACGLQCNSGFELQNGSPVRICLPNGHWSGMQPRWLIMFFYSSNLNLSAILNSNIFGVVLWIAFFGNR